ncbi:MAG: hypothetical protein ACRDHZ_14490, partial [Ktedonobacteraceae bacterium]
MNKQQFANLQGRRQILLGLTGLVGVMVSGCSFGSTSTQTPQGAPTQSPGAITPTPEVAQGTTLYVYRKHTEQIDDIAWSPNNQYIISASNGTFSQVSEGTPAQLYMWDASTGEPNALFAANPNNVGVTPAPLAWS